MATCNMYIALSESMQWSDLFPEKCLIALLSKVFDCELGYRFRFPV